MSCYHKYIKNIKLILSLMISLLVISIILIFLSYKGIFQVFNKYKSDDTLLLVTTTSVQDSGILDYLVKEFEKDCHVKVKPISVGSGKALKMISEGEADAAIVHDKDKELELLSNGKISQRYEIMHNDFIIVGPGDKSLTSEMSLKNDAVKALKKIYELKCKFISRGDNSGTHEKEKKLWIEAGINPDGDFYVSSGRGMGECLKMADDIRAYTLTDRATYLTLKQKLKLNLSILVEDDPRLANQYSVISPNYCEYSKANEKTGRVFVEWIISEKVQKMIKDYGKEKFGETLFTPNFILMRQEI